MIMMLRIDVDFLMFCEEATFAIYQVEDLLDELFHHLLLNADPKRTIHRALESEVLQKIPWFQASKSVQWQVTGSKKRLG